MLSAMTELIALITGANKGIGLETARQLGGHGMTVLLGARDEARGLADVELWHRLMSRTKASQ